MTNIAELVRDLRAVAEYYRVSGLYLGATSVSGACNKAADALERLSAPSGDDDSLLREVAVTILESHRYEHSASALKHGVIGTQECALLLAGMTTYANIRVAQERERCAGIADEDVEDSYRAERDDDYYCGCYDTATEIAAAIRSTDIPAGPGGKSCCTVYHSRAVGMKCSNCGHSKEDHMSQDGKARETEG